VEVRDYEVVFRQCTSVPIEAKHALLTANREQAVSPARTERVFCSRPLYIVAVPVETLIAEGTGRYEIKENTTPYTSISRTLTCGVPTQKSYPSIAMLEKATKW